MILFVNIYIYIRLMQRIRAIRQTAHTSICIQKARTNQQTQDDARAQRKPHLLSETEPERREQINLHTHTYKIYLQTHF